MLPQANLFGHSALLGVIPMVPNVLLRPIVIGAILAFAGKTSTELAQSDIFTLPRAFAIASVLALAVVYMNTATVKTFLYFAF